MYKKLLPFFIALLLSGQAFAESSFKTSEELRDQYPNITDYSERKENKNILCPFHRMLERSGIYDTKKESNNSKILVSIVKMISAAREFGCKKLGCGAVATAVSVGQNTYGSDFLKGHTKLGYVNITRLHHARGIAHACGLTFSKGGSVVSDSVRASTLRKLKAISERNNFKGQLSEKDIMSVKKDICKSQNVKMSKAGAFEVSLIYNYLGGKDRGFVEYSDVERFFHSKMPLTKSIDGL